MNHQDHVNLLRQGIPKPGGNWADFGSGRGAFTLALAELIGPTGTIYSVDKDQGALRQQEKLMLSRFPEVIAHYMRADFTEYIELPSLDGLVVANSLHYLRHKDETIQLLKSYLGPAGRFVVIEYNTDRGNPWVPHPFSYDTWLSLAKRNGFANTELLARAPSSFLGEFYAAVSYGSAGDTRKQTG